MFAGASVGVTINDLILCALIGTGVYLVVVIQQNLTKPNHKQTKRVRNLK